MENISNEPKNSSFLYDLIFSIFSLVFLTGLYVDGWLHEHIINDPAYIIFR